MPEGRHRACPRSSPPSATSPTQALRRGVLRRAPGPSSHRRCASIPRPRWPVQHGRRDPRTPRGTLATGLSATTEGWVGRTAGDARERFAPGFGAIFEPDVVTAHQWHSRSWLSDMPEGRLVLAVLEDAIRTLQRDPKGAPGRDAARWFAADQDDGSAFSFVR